MRILQPLGLSFAALALVACGQSSGGEQITVEPVEGGEEPTSSRSLAYIMDSYTKGEPSSAVDPKAQDDWDFATAVVAAELRFNSTGEYDGDMLALGVFPKTDKELVSEIPQDSFSEANCAEVEGAIVLWEEHAPEEDPGGVYAAYRKGEHVALIMYTGPAIEANPLEQQLPVPVETLVAILQDPRVDATTSEAALTAGEKLTYFKD